MKKYFSCYGFIIVLIYEHNSANFLIKCKVIFQKGLFRKNGTVLFEVTGK